MGTIRKVGDSYYIEFEARGLKYQQKAGPDPKAAQKLLEETEAKIRQGEMGIIVRDATVEIFIKDFADFASKQYSTANAKRLHTAADQFATYLKSRQSQVQLLSQITPKVIEDYKFSLLRDQKTPIEPGVVNFTILLLREMFEYAIKLGYLNDNPTLHIKIVADPVQKAKELVVDESTRKALEKGGSIFQFAKLMKMDDVMQAMPFYHLLKNPLNE